MNLKRMLAAAITFASTMMLFVSSAFAEGGAPDNADSWKGQLALAIGLGLGLAAVGGAMGQGKAASAALEGIGRNPAAADKLFRALLLIVPEKDGYDPACSVFVRNVMDHISYIARQVNDKKK